MHAFPQGLYGDEFEDEFGYQTEEVPLTNTGENADQEQQSAPDDGSAEEQKLEHPVAAKQPAQALPIPVRATEMSPLPPKPSLSATAATAASLSYSAQVAQQFSTYRQTPSQERQQRNIESGPSGSQGRIDRPIRPSEMKDEG